MASLIFDFDGTIVDSLPLYLDIIYKGRTNSPSTLTPEEEAQIRTMPLMKAVRQLDVPAASRLRLVWARYKHLNTRIQEAHPFKNVHHALSELHQKGHKLYIMSSNYERNVHAFLRAHDLEHYFSGVYHTPVLLKARGLKKLMKKEGLNPKDSYYIANEPADIRAGHKAGVHSIATLWSGQNPQALSAEKPMATVARPEDLPAVFKAA